MSVAADKRSKRGEANVRAEATETHTTLFEWPLHGLKHLFDSSKADTKSKVVKSAPFGGGRWTVLFYAQSGHEQFCSLYLNAEPLPQERVHPLLGATQDVPGATGSGASSSSKSAKGDSAEERWSREGLFRFTFSIQTLEKNGILGTKEAHDHAFSHKTSNWGWAQFAKRDVCYYNHASVKQADAFLITVCITASPEKPRMMKPVGHTVPTHLVQAIGSLLDDPDHSDIVFHLISQRRSSNGRSGPTESIKKIYAIKKILAARSEYFSDMFEGGFAEGEQYSTGGDDSDDSASSPPALDHSRPSANRAAHADGQEEVEEDYDYDYQNDTLLHDSDEELEESLPPASSNRMSPRISSSAQASYDHASDNDEELDDDDFRGDDYGGATMNTSRKLSNVFEDATDAIGIPQASLPSSQPSANDTAELRSPMAVDGDNNLRTSVNAVTAGASLPSNVATLSGSGAGIDATDAMDATASPVTPTKVKSKRTRVRGRDVGGENAQRFDRRKRRKVVVRDSAYATFKALLYFLYTDTIEFAPLTSSFLDQGANRDEGAPSSGFGTDAGRDRSTGSSQYGFTEEMHKAHRRRKAVIDAYCAQNPDKPSPCSAKAMYRLADKLHIPELKRRAQEHIANSLSVQNIVWEVFSGFNTQFPDIRKMETDFLLKHWPQVKKTSAMKTVFHRVGAHPGLADVWPYLLSQLDYRPKGDGDDANDASDSE